MKRLASVIVIGAMVLGGLAWFGLYHPGADKINTDTQPVTFDSMQQDLQNGAKLYDVRTADEYAAGHFAGATNWPLQDMQAGTLPDVAKDTKVYVYCRSGNRSGQATVLLRNAGYTSIHDLHGLSAVEALGGKLVTD